MTAPMIGLADPGPLSDDPTLPPDAALALERDTMDALDAMERELDLMTPAHSVEIEPVDGSMNSLALHDIGILENGEQPGPDDEYNDDEPSTAQEFGLADAAADPHVRQALESMYGHGFPLIQDSPRESDWSAWAEDLWGQGSAGVQKRLHLVDRNRKMRAGVQWVSSMGLGPWREPPKPKDAARVVENCVAPALDQRVQIIAEQRPGWRVKPQNQEQRNIKKSESQQIALEHQYDQQQMAEVIREASYWAGTDGVSFPCVYWDGDRGPWDEAYDPEGQRPTPAGDLATKVYRIEQVRVSPNASGTRRPWYWVVKETIPMGEAVRDYGPEVVEGTGGGEHGDTDIGMTPNLRFDGVLPDHDELIRDRGTIDRTYVWCERSQVLGQGLLVVLVGRKLVMGPVPLPWGVVPMVRWTDGSSDPAWYPQPVMDGWIDSQMRINALKSRWVESVRLNGGTKLLAREQAIAGETLLGSTLSIITVKGAGPLGDTVQPLPAFSIAADLVELLDRERKQFEDVSGWNDVSRGSFNSDQSGRSILAQREMLERIFAPPVTAGANAMCQWARINVAGMRWGYDAPRVVSIEGAGRPDLVRELTADDFDGVPNVSVDPETLMPMPRALRLALLDSQLEKGVISMAEYRRRQPFAFTANLDTPDTDHYSRAKRVCEAIRTSFDGVQANPHALPILWMDEDAIHQDVLQRELILPDDVPQPIRDAAYQRWMMHAQQAAMKGGMTGGAPPMPMPGSGAAPPGQPMLGAGSQPMASTNPGVAAGSSALVGGSSDEDAAAREFDATHQR